MDYAWVLSRRCPLTRPLILALGLLLALPTAHAADLDLKVTSDGIGPVSVTLKDVKAGALPSVDLPGPDGRSMRVDMKLADSTVEGEPAYDLTLTITKRTPAGRKKVHEEVSQPTLRFRANQPAEIFMGGERPIPGTDPVEMEPMNFVRVNALIRSDAPAG